MKEEKLQEERKFYKEHLINAYYSINRSYDRDVLTIAGGGLALFIGFVDGVVEDLNSAEHVIMMKFSWLFLAASMFLIMFRHYVGIKSHRKTLEQLDKGKNPDEQMGGMWTKIERYSFFLSAVSLFMGLGIAIYFIWINTGGQNNV